MQTLLTLKLVADEGFVQVSVVSFGQHCSPLLISKKKMQSKTTKKFQKHSNS